MPARFNTEALLALTFGDRVSDAQCAGGTENGLLYDLPSTDGAPFFGVTTQYCSTQQFLSVFGTASLNGEYLFNDYSENTEPSGTARCLLTRDGALKQAETMMGQIQTGDFSLQCVTAYQALEAFQFSGVAAAKAEACYLMRFDGQSATAVPAYRYQNQFVHALTGVKQRSNHTS